MTDGRRHTRVEPLPGDCVVRSKDGKLAEQTGKHVTKGRLVYVEGRLASRFFTDKDGTERAVTEVIASDVQFLDGPSTTSTDLPIQEHTADTDFDDLDIPF